MSMPLSANSNHRGKNAAPSRAVLEITIGLLMGTIFLLLSARAAEAEPKPPARLVPDDDHVKYWLDSIIRADFAQQLASDYATAFCHGEAAALPGLYSESRGCEHARVKIGSDGSITYQAPEKGFDRQAGSWCLANPSQDDTPGQRARPWPDVVLVALSAAGGDSVDKPARCGIAQRGIVYGSMQDAETPAVALRIATSRPSTQFRKELRDTAEQYQQARADKQFIWPFVQRFIRLPLEEVPAAKLYFSGQIPARKESAKSPLYLLNAKSGKQHEGASLFDSQKPLFFVYNLRENDRVCFARGKVLDDSAVPLAIIGLFQTAVSKIAPASMGVKAPSLAVGKPVTRPVSDPLEVPLYERASGEECKLRAVCDGGIGACEELKNSAKHFVPLCSLIQTIPQGSEGSNRWQQLGRAPILVNLIRDEIARLGEQMPCRAAPDRQCEPIHAGELQWQLHDNLKGLVQRAESARSDEIIANFKDNVAEASRTAVVVPPSRELAGGSIYDLKVFHDDAGQNVCKDSDGTDGTDEEVAKKTTEPKPGATESDKKAAEKKESTDPPAKALPHAFATRGFAVRSHRPFFSTATEMSVDIRLWPSNTPLGGYRFEKVAGSSGPDQLYQLLPQQRQQQHVSFAQLVVLYPFARCENRWLEGLGLAGGPTFIHASGTGAFTQFNLRVLWEPPITRGALISFGPSLRWVDVPLHYQEGMVVTLPPAAPEPTFATSSRLMVLFSLGVVLDEVVVGKTVADKLAALKPASKSK